MIQGKILDTVVKTKSRSHFERRLNHFIYFHGDVFDTDPS